MRRWTVILICLLTIYAPLELSRLIINYGLEPALIFELCWLWLFYFIAVKILTKEVRGLGINQ